MENRPDVGVVAPVQRAVAGHRWVALDRRRSREEFLSAPSAEHR